MNLLDLHLPAVGLIFNSIEVLMCIITFINELNQLLYVEVIVVIIITHTIKVGICTVDEQT